jgi:8-oxo-dGTP diphosphatase
MASTLGDANSSERHRYAYRHPHPAVSVDTAIFTVRDERLELLLIRRGVQPFKGTWALPGGFVRMDEDLAAAAERELREEAGITGAFLKQVGAFGRPDRDPRERVISVAFYAVIPAADLNLTAGTDATEARWWPFAALPETAFDHRQIIAAAHEAVVEALTRTAVAYQFLPQEFTLTELQQVHEAIRGHALDKRNFRKWVAALDTVRPSGRTRRGGRFRPAQLFRVRRRTNATAL